MQDRVTKCSTQFNIIAFSTLGVKYKEEPVNLNEESLQDAHLWLRLVVLTKEQTEILRIKGVKLNYNRTSSDNLGNSHSENLIASRIICIFIF